MCTFVDYLVEVFEADSVLLVLSRMYVFESCENSIRRLKFEPET